MESGRTSQEVRSQAHPVQGQATDYDELIEAAGDKEIVLLGENTHGTHEFYEARAYITQRLIEEKGFSAVLAEADWPDAYRINRYVRGPSADTRSIDSLSDFQRFPLWMWRNTDVLDFVGWLRVINQSLLMEERIGFYGLDLYSLYASLEGVVRYLEKVDTKASQQAREVFNCFDRFGSDPQMYGLALSAGLDPGCEGAVVRQLEELRKKQFLYLQHDGFASEEEHFCAEMNAQLARHAERYYREMYRGDVSSWNLRDSHMTSTIEAVRAHLTRRIDQPKVVVWAHNSHLGDASSTSMGQRGEYNVGQLVRERYGDRALSVGFFTYSGTVIAASHWDGPAERKVVTPARDDSYEKIFHQTGLPAFSLRTQAVPALEMPRRERAIGVIYRPQTELLSHYLYASLTGQFDWVVHFDRTRALEPLDPMGARWEDREPETYPTGL